MSFAGLKVVIRVDATKDVALGHLKRCISLGCKLREKNIDVLFITVKDAYTKGLLGESGFKHVSISSSADPNHDMNITVNTAKAINADLVLIDSYHIGQAYRRELMNEGFFVVSIDDLGDKAISSHMIINGNINAENIKYKGDGIYRVLAGSKYLILSPDFWSLNILKRPNTIRNILITMGGIDHYDLTSRILAVLNRFDLEFNITAIVGPYYDNMDSIKSQMKNMRHKVTLARSPNSLYSYMKRSSMAFSAGGQTLYELAALGCPTIGISLWKNQAGNVASLSKRNAICGIIYSKENRFDETLFDYAQDLITDAAKRKRLSDVAFSIIDGKGTERTAKAVLQAYEEWKKCSRKEMVL